MTRNTTDRSIDSTGEARVLEIERHAELLEDEDLLDEMRTNLRAGSVYVARRVVPRDVLERIRAFLVDVGRGSLPNYQAIERGAPNFHRMNDQDPRAFVGGCFHQWSFFPWNQDPFRMFSLFREVYAVKNRLSGLPADRFLGSEPEMGCTARLSFQYYPRGCGALGLHADPVDHHQLVVPSMALSRKGEDFDTGGVFVEPTSGHRLMAEDLLDWGDVLYFRAQNPHGVELIDPDAEADWLSFRGRWSLIFAVNKVSGNNAIEDSRPL